MYLTFLIDNMLYLNEAIPIPDFSLEEGVDGPNKYL